MKIDMGTLENGFASIISGQVYQLEKVGLSKDSIQLTLLSHAIEAWTNDFVDIYAVVR